MLFDFVTLRAAFKRGVLGALAPSKDILYCIVIHTYIYMFNLIIKFNYTNSLYVIYNNIIHISMSIEYKCILTNIGPLSPGKKSNPLLASIDENNFNPFVKCLMNLSQSRAFECLTTCSNFSSLIDT